VQALLQEMPMHDAWNAAWEAARSTAGLGSLAPDTPGPAPLPTGFWERLAAVESKQYTELQPSGYAGYVVECLEAAAWCCLNAGSPEDALVLAVNLAGEADTIAAVAGGIAGAAWGRGALPPRWLAALHQREYVEQTAERLARLRGS
jgi:ADP-ribosyl-[dinitrogen reductase] hydrolase